MTIAGIIAALVAIEAVFRYVQLVLVAVAGQRTMFEMRMRLFEHIQRMSLRFLDRHPTGRLMTRVTNDVEKNPADHRHRRRQHRPATS